MQYLKDGHWTTISQWAQFLIALGSCAARAPSDTTRLVIGLALPTRAFAAAFTMLGLVVTRDQIQPATEDAKAHFRALCRLPHDTPVQVHGVETVEKGKLIGSRVDPFSEQTQIGILVKDGVRRGRALWTQRWLPEQGALKIQVVDDEPSSESHFGKRRQREESPFLRQILADRDARQFVRASRLDCLVIGRGEVLKQEICETPIGVEVPQREIEQGTFQEAVRVRRFGGPGEGYRSQVLPPASAERGLVRRLQPAFVIFDGATAFLQLRDAWRQCPWIILLDRTDTRFEDATALLNERYTLRRIDGPRLRGVPRPPERVELRIHWEAR